MRKLCLRIFYLSYLTLISFSASFCNASGSYFLINPRSSAIARGEFTLISKLYIVSLIKKTSHFTEKHYTLHPFDMHYS